MLLHGRTKKDACACWSILIEKNQDTTASENSPSSGSDIGQNHRERERCWFQSEVSTSSGSEVSSARAMAFAIGMIGHYPIAITFSSC